MVEEPRSTPAGADDSALDDDAAMDIVAQRARMRPTTLKKLDAFLVALEHYGRPGSAAVKAGMRKNHMYRFRKLYPWFDEAWDEALEAFRHSLWEHAKDGIYGTGSWSKQGPNASLTAKAMSAHLEEFKQEKGAGGVTINIVTAIPQPKRLNELRVVDAEHRALPEGEDEDE